MDYLSAKLRVNPDPDWEPVKNSREHHEIIALMRANGYKDIADEIRRAPRLVPVNTKTMKNPLTRELPFYVQKKTMSKNEFLSHPSNKKQIQEHMSQNVPIMATRQILPPLVPEIALAELEMPPKGSRLSKHEFMKLGNVKEYVENHILRNKK